METEILRRRDREMKVHRKCNIGPVTENTNTKLGLPEFIGRTSQ